MQNLTNPNNSSNVKEYARYVNGDHQAQFYQAYGAFIHLRNVVAKKHDRHGIPATCDEAAPSKRQIF